MKIKYCLAAICLSINCAAQADSEFGWLQSKDTAPSTSSGKWSYSVALDFMSFEPGGVTEQGLGDRATAVQLSGVYSASRYLAASIGVGLFSLDDDNQQAELVVDNDGFVRVVESETRGTSVFGELYFQNATSFDRSFSYRFGLGFNSIANARREFDSCDNCEKTSFELNGGGYWLASVGKQLGNGSGLGLTARHYMAGDLENSVLLWWQARI
jgi:uncharacterized membrane protein (Fun14 family)